MNEIAKELIKEYEKRYNAELKYSSISGRFYVSARVDIDCGVCKMGINEHRENPEDAIMAFHERITEAKLEGILVRY